MDVDGFTRETVDAWLIMLMEHIGDLLMELLLTKEFCGVNMCADLFANLYLAWPVVFATDFFSFLLV